MKILQITSHLDTGGITRYVLSLSQHLMEKGHRVRIASGGGQLEGRAEAIGLEQWRVPLKTSQEFGYKTFRSIRQLMSLLERDPVDILHAHTRVAQVAADQISRRLRIPCVMTWHGIYKRRLGRRGYPCTGEICIAISEMVRQHLLKDFRVPPENIRLIYNGIDTTYFGIPPDPSVIRMCRERWGISGDQPVIGGIGRLASGEVKGFDLLLAAASLLKKMAPGVQTLIVGEGPRRPFLEDVADRLGILDRVHFVGEVEDIRIPLALMDVFIFPSRWPEAFGLTLVEAMAAGRPVVAARIGAVPEIVRDGVDGFLVDPEDIQGIARNAFRLLDNRALANQAAHQAQLRVRERFNLDRMTLEVEEIYREVVGRRSAGTARSR